MTCGFLGVRSNNGTYIPSYNIVPVTINISGPTYTVYVNEFILTPLKSQCTTF